MAYAAFRSIGAYIPPKIMTNADFEKIIDTSDEWITKRTGIKERRLSEAGEASSDLGAKAAQVAIDRAGIAKEDIDLAMTKGVNYPKGLLKWADEIGLDKVLNQLEALQAEYGEDRYRPSVLLRRMVRENKTSGTNKQIAVPVSCFFVLLLC